MRRGAAEHAHTYMALPSSVPSVAELTELQASSSALNCCVIPSLMRRLCSLGAGPVAGAVAWGLIHDTILSHRFGSGGVVVSLKPALSVAWVG